MFIPGQLMAKEGTKTQGGSARSSGAALDVQHWIRIVYSGDEQGEYSQSKHNTDKACTAFQPPFPEQNDGMLS